MDNLSPHSHSGHSSHGSHGAPSAGTTAATSTSSSTARPPKRIRLNLACNNCRRRKVKCDTEQPKCRNCWLRDEECLTTDPRYPPSRVNGDGGPNGNGDERGRPQIRRWATPNGLMPGQNPAATHRNHAYVAKHGPVTQTAVQTHAPAYPPPPPETPPNQHHASPPRPRRPSTIVVSASTPAASPPPISWVSRSYQYSETAEAQAEAGGGDVGVCNANGPTNHTGNENENAHDSVHATGPTTVATTSSYDADVVVNTDDAAPHRVKYMGGSSLQCLAGFVDIFLRRKRLPLVSTAFTSGMRHAEEFSLPLVAAVPRLPPAGACRASLDVFFDRVWPLYPVVDRPTVEQDLRHVGGLEQTLPAGASLLSVLAHDDVPGLVVLLAVLAIGAGEGQVESERGGSLDDTESGLIYITAGFGLVAHLIARPYLRSVQSMLLLAVALRLRARDGQAWYLVGQAVRVAHSIGLHRQVGATGAGADAAPHSSDPEREPTLQSRVWWSLYALEKLMELETGRPSAIPNDEPLPPLPLPPPTTDSASIFAPWVALSSILGQISRRLYVQKPASAVALLTEIAQLDDRLQAWSASLPEPLKPGYDVSLSVSSPSTAVFTTYLALHFYLAQMAVLRAAIVFPTRSFAAEVERAFPEGTPTPSPIRNKHRLLQAESLCTAAARSTIHRVLDLADSVPASASSHIISPTLTFQAAVVLALHILRAPGKRLVRADCELLASATLHLETQYCGAGQHPGFVRILDTLRTSVAAAAEQHTATPPALSAGPATVASTPNRRESGVVTPVTTNLPPTGQDNYAPTAPGMDMAFFDLDGDGMGHLEAFWNAMGPVNFLDPGLESA
ncbi:hypothetical protein SPBR_04101 [Sporothrix brasiliensis 5110]|uniref:Zn(2)-C6 fungal-type domain-containing protein n=1 Tax=Sporothrix brasiliensis 5110 TaxID=1398154 RepID=A0A0C2IX06_9PEZI|nr:uncharacterized protein SPBR_04101 [Sporothrix brasiliensis 5110]KIH93626.1 hypothetical protein SPBR_04101 [Sporothrix brasiliensis 5110]